MRFLLRAAVIVSIAAGVSAIATAANARDGQHARVRGHLELRSHHSYAGAVAVASPGVLSGNVIQVPVNVPVNLCGNTIDIIAALNPPFGNTCLNVSARGSSSGHEFRSNFHGH